MHRLRRSGIVVALAALLWVPATGALAHPAAHRSAPRFKASLLAWPDHVLTGDKLYLDASGSSHRPKLVDFRWDLGTGKFTLDTKDIPWTSTSFSSPGVKTVRVMVRNSTGRSAIASATVTVRRGK